MLSVDYATAGGRSIQAARFVRPCDSQVKLEDSAASRLTPLARWSQIRYD